jgi:hypothetical protein
MNTEFQYTPLDSASQPSLSLLGCYRNSSVNFYISCGGHDGGLCSMGVGSGFVSA